MIKDDKPPFGGQDGVKIASKIVSKIDVKKDVVFDRLGRHFGSLLAPFWLPFSVPDRSWTAINIKNVDFYKIIQKPIENQ